MKTYFQYFIKIQKVSMKISANGKTNEIRSHLFKHTILAKEEILLSAASIAYSCLSNVGKLRFF